MNSNHEKNLPVKGDMAIMYACSLLIVVLMAAVSIIGLQYRTLVYPTEEFVRALMPNDVVNLVVGLPILLGSLWLAWHRKLVGLLCWIGALFFVLYNYLAYAFALPLHWIYLLHLTLVMLSAYTLAGLIAVIDGKAVRQCLAGNVPEKLGGGVLTGLGLLFFLRVIGVITNSLTQGAIVPKTELAVHISDFLITPAWMIVGILLWRRKDFGYVMGLGLLFQASMLFLALMIFMLVQPLLTNVPFAATDLLVIFTMGLICFGPFTLFVRGAVGRRSSSSQ